MTVESYTFNKELKKVDEVQAKYKELVLKIGKYQKNITNKLKKGNKYRALLVAMITFLSTFQILMNHKSNDHISYSDTIVFEKSIIGSVIDKKKSIRTVQQFQNKFLSVLGRLKGLNDILFQSYFSAQSEFIIETFQATDKKKPFSTFNITKQMKETDFDIKNISYVLKLDFPINNVTLLKDHLQAVNVIRIRGTDIVLLSKDSVGAPSCRKWVFSIDFDLEEMDNAQEHFEKTYQDCQSDNYDRDDDLNESGADGIIFEEFFFFNSISLVFNLLMTMFILQVIIDISKYQTMNEDKMAKYRWLLRNRKNFDGTSKLEEILNADGEFSEVQVFDFWNMVLVLGNVFSLIANLIVAINSLSLAFRMDQIEFFTQFFLGFGCFFSWLNLLQVLSQYKEFAIVTKTLINSAPGIFWFTIGTAPIFLAFVFAGFCMYHESERFQDLSSSYMGLLALMAGDEVQNVFFDAEDYPLSGWFTSIYCVVFMFAIANVFVFLIESGYQMELNAIERREEDQKLKDKIDEKTEKGIFAAFKKAALTGAVLKRQNDFIDDALGRNKDENLKAKQQNSKKIEGLFDNLKKELKNTFSRTEQSVIGDAMEQIEMMNDLLLEYETVVKDFETESIDDETKQKLRKTSALYVSMIGTKLNLLAGEGDGQPKL